MITSMDFQAEMTRCCHFSASQKLAGDSWLQYVGTKESMTDELTLNDSKNAIALLMESMQHVSRSGEKGGP